MNETETTDLADDSTELPDDPQGNSGLDAMVMPKELTKDGNSDPVIRKAKWAALKEEFIELAITGKDIHWPTLANKYGFNPQTCRNRASTGKWYAEIENRRKLREQVLEQQLSERSKLALDKLNEDFATSEAAVRKRHATIARGLQVKAVARLREFELKDFKPSDVISLLRLGLEEERFALGLPQVYEAPPAADEAHAQYKPIAEQLGGHEKVRKIGLQLLKALQTMPDVDDEPTDVEVKAPAPAPVQSIAPPAPAAPAVSKPKPKVVLVVKKKAS